MEKIPELIAANMLLVAVITGVLGLIIGILIGSYVRTRRKRDDGS
jgi:uncharacterized protein YneF (UPF0154 family)